MSVTPEQINVWLEGAGISMGGFHMLLGMLLVALYLILTLKLLKGSIKGWSAGKLKFYDVLGRGGRLSLIFIVILYLVTP